MMKIDNDYRIERIFSPEGHAAYLRWFIKKSVNKVGSLGKRYWYRLSGFYPWEAHKLGFIEDDQQAVKDKIEKLLGKRCFPISIDREQFNRFLQKWGKIISPYDIYYKKSLEYFLTWQLMDFKKNDVYMDIGSWISPFPEVLRGRVKKIYCQDISYRRGFYKNQIGCNAAHIPLPNDSVDKMTLHCTFEHFEGDNDTLFMREVSRLLNVNGKCFIIPLYLGSEFINLTDPSLFFIEAFGKGFTFDPETKVYPRFGLLNKFARIYSPAKFVERVISASQNLRPTLYWIEEAPWLPITQSMSFALMLEKK